MGQVEDKSRHIPWEARAYPGGHLTHYEKGYVYEAMLLMRDHRQEFDQIIRNLCTQVNESPRLPAPGIIARFWVNQVSEKLLPSFVKDNFHPEFTEERIREVYGQDISNFFSDIHLLISNQKPSPELENLSFPIRNGNINIGWTALLREFGLFHTMSSYIHRIIERSSGNNIHSKSIVSEVTSTIPDEHFVNHDRIQCPAANQVQNHLALSIGLNAGLIKRKIYSSSNHISFLEDDETGHFKSVEKMCAEYDSKIRGTNTL